MKLHKLSFLVLFLSTFGCYGQTSDAEFNLDFEKNPAHAVLPDGWIKWGTPDYLVQKDTLAPHTGAAKVVGNE